MPANLLAGEVGIVCEGREYIFRPSFCRLATLDTPKGLIDLYTDVQKRTKVGFQAALYVLTHFIDCEPEDAQKLLGYYREVRGKTRYISGKIREPEDIQTLALHLLTNAMVGKPSRKRGAEADKFDTMEYVGFAVAHFGMTFEEAGKMTMHEFQAASVAKFGKPKEDDVPTAEELDDLRAEWDKVVSNG